MEFDREQFYTDGYLIRRNVIPPEQLDQIRTAYEVLVERQKQAWVQSRRPGDPPGGVWETSPQPRLQLGHNTELIDRQTAAAVEVWQRDTIQGLSSQLLNEEDAAVTEMMLMCSPVEDRGPAAWHRDIHPIDTAPLNGYIDDIAENGPRYVQWNIPLYDDDVLWVVPGTHLRLNTAEENRQLLANPRVPLDSGVQTHLKAGDGVVYITPILHWGSNYSAKLRRTIHGGFSTFTHYPDLSYLPHLDSTYRANLERWAQRSSQVQDSTEAALRATIAADSKTFFQALEALHPGRGPKGQLLTTVYLCKAALFIYLQKFSDLDIPEDLRNRGAQAHPSTLNWGPQFAQRFTLEQAATLWSRFSRLDARLQASEEHFSPGFQSGPMRYHFNQMPAAFEIGDFVSEWAA